MRDRLDYIEIDRLDLTMTPLSVAVHPPTPEEIQCRIAAFRTPAPRLIAGAVVSSPPRPGSPPVRRQARRRRRRDHRRLADRQDQLEPVLHRHAGGRRGRCGRRRRQLTLAAGKEDGDEDTQIKAIEDAIARGDQGILITPNGPGVLDAIGKARDAGLYVIALDTPPDPADAVDITFATDNRLAGQLIGEWTAAQLGGEKATIALLDLFDDKIVSVDYNRDQGFLEGMGIDVADGNTNGDEAATGTYCGRRLRDRR